MSRRHLLHHPRSILSHFYHSSRVRLRRIATRVFILIVLVCAVASTKDPMAVQASTPPLHAVSVSAPAPLVRRAPKGEMFVDVSVLTYNVKGLPWPLRMDLPDPDPDAAMVKIGKHLDALRAAGNAPDIVLIQEGFTDTATDIGRWGNYRFAAHGPTRADANDTTMAAADTILAAGADWTRGESQGPVLNSGLHAFSDYPLTVRASRAFGRYVCAGFDCLAAKGVLVLGVDIPGVPEPVTVLTLHMNANGASGVPEPRALAAHRLQIDRFADVLQSAADPALPLIFGGDFNVKAAHARQNYADARLTPARLTAVHLSCKAPACVPGYPTRENAHWLEPRDIQGYRGGARIQVTPLSSEEMFAGPASGGQLSDHAGYLVRYRLSWVAP